MKRRPPTTTLFPYTTLFRSTAREQELLERYSPPVHDLRPASVRARSSHPFEAVDESGRRLYVKFLEPDRLERDWLYRLWRPVGRRGVQGPRPGGPPGRPERERGV